MDESPTMMSSRASRGLPRSLRKTSNRSIRTWCEPQRPSHQHKKCSSSELCNAFDVVPAWAVVWGPLRVQVLFVLCPWSLETSRPCPWYDVPTQGRPGPISGLPWPPCGQGSWLIAWTASSSPPSQVWHGGRAQWEFPCFANGAYRLKAPGGYVSWAKVIRVEHSGRPVSYCLLFSRCSLKHQGVDSNIAWLYYM